MSLSFNARTNTLVSTGSPQIVIDGGVVEADVGLTADVGSAQGNGVITSFYNVYSTVANAGDAATLQSTFTSGTVVYIKNDGANSMDIFPASGDDAGAGANTAVALPAGESVTFIATTTDTTWTELIVPPSASGGGGGDVTKVGTPVNNQLGIWTGDGTLEGDADVTYDSSTGLFYVNSTNGTAGSVSVAAPGIVGLFSASASAAGAGGAVNIISGDGNTTGAGGAIAITGGVSGAGATGTGGAVATAGGASAATNGDGGAASLTSGLAAGTGTGGLVTIKAANSGAGATGTGGSILIDAGDGVSTLGIGGNVDIFAGSGVGTSSAENAGSIIVRAGAITGSGAALPGDITVEAGGSTTSANGGTALLQAGQGTSAGGQAQVRGGAGQSNGPGGSASLLSGAGAGTGAGADAVITAGASGTGATGNGGNVNITSGAATSTNGTGGNVNITTGAPTGTGSDAFIVLSTDTVEAARFIAAIITTTDATVTEILATPITSGDTKGFEIHCVGTQDATGDTVFVRVFGAIRNQGGTTALVGSTITDRTDDAGATTWAITVAADDTTDELTVDVTGEAAHTIDWKIRLYEMNV